MRVFTVMKPGGTKNHEFEAYKSLLEEIGIDLSNVPRIREPGTLRRWLYVWKDCTVAQRFARELRERMRDPSWTIHEFDLPAEESGPLAPLDVIAEQVAGGTVYRLSSASQERIMRGFPNARLTGEVFLSDHDSRDGGSFWDQVINRLSGLTEAQVNDLGGYRVYEIRGRTLHESTVASN